MGRWNKGIKSFRDLFMAFLYAWFVLVGLLIFPYVSPVYFFIVNSYISFLENYYFPMWIFLMKNPLSIVLIVILGILLIGWIFYYKEQRKRIRLRAIEKFSEVMKLSPREFEEFVADMLKQKWFHTLLWVWVKDGGVDVTATLGDKKFLIQCKHYREENIGVEKIRELNGVMKKYLDSVAWWIFVTTTLFTSEAVLFATECWIELWDRNYLIEYLKENHE